MLRFVMSMILFVLAGAIATAQEAESRVEKLCKALGSNDAQEREQASKDLIAIGKPAAAALKKLLDSPDPEVKARAEFALTAIRERLRKDALTLVVSTDKKTYRPGEVVKVEARLRNAEDAPVVAVKFEWDGAMTANSWITVERDGHGVNYAGDPLPQVMVNTKVDEGRFLTVPPKGETAVRWVEFSEAWDLGDKDPSMKASYEDAKRAPLAPGKYKAKAIYEFRVSKESPEDPDFGKRFEFHAKARELFDQCWRGSLEAEVEFTVTDKDVNAK